MSAQDIWAREWTINDAVADDGTDALQNVLLIQQGVTRFRLTPVFDGANLTCYRVEFNPGEMAACWQPPCYLFPRGNNTVDAPSSTTLPPLPLPQWQAAPVNGTPPERVSYEEVASAIASDCEDDPTAECLQGDIHVNGVPEAVTFYQAAGVLQNSTFLAIRVESKAGEVTERESGIAHGNT